MTAPANPKPTVMAFPKDRPAQDAFVIALLLRLQLVTLDDIFDYGIHLQPYETRNRNVSVRIRSGLGVHVKLPVNEAGRLALQEEAKVLDHLAANLPPAQRKLVPQPRGLDQKTGGLVTGFLHGVGPSRRAALLASLPPAALGELALLLRDVHATPCETLRSAGELPFAAGLLRPALGYVHHASSADLRLIRLVQDSSVLRGSVERLARDWRADAFIHGDMKLENLLLLPHGQKFALLDWEYARPGDARWDIGSLIAELIYVWVIGTVARDLGGAEANEDVAQALALPQLQRLVHAFAAGYAGAASEDLITSCADFVVARLLQSVMEAHKFRVEIDLTGVRALQAAENIAQDQETFRRFLAVPR